MKKKILSIIGNGFVGGTIYKAFKKNNIIKVIDLLNKKEVDQTLSSELIFICLPTNLIKKKLDTSLIEGYLAYYNKKKFKGIIAIKSTLNIGDTKRFIKKYKNLNNKICFVPEFLRERCALKDFKSKNNILVVGTNSKITFQKIINVHNEYQFKTSKVSPNEAELLKLFSNAYNANRIVFANSFFEICKYFDSDYDKILKTYLLRNNSSGNYLQCNENLRGYSGKCLPKDIQSLQSSIEKSKIKINFFQSIINENNKFKKTILK